MFVCSYFFFLANSTINNRVVNMAPVVRSFYPDPFEDSSESSDSNSSTLDTTQTNYRMLKRLMGVDFIESLNYSD